MPLVRAPNLTWKRPKWPVSSVPLSVFLLHVACHDASFCRSLLWQCLGCWSVLADWMWEYFVCCRWLKMQRVVLSKYRFQENTYAIGPDPQPFHWNWVNYLNIFKQLYRLSWLSHFQSRKVVSLSHWPFRYWQLVVTILRGCRRSTYFWAPVILRWDHLWLSMNCIKALQTKQM